mmetsp:Transcript_25975/g.71272  ORF Transcript_25975/g.71272 Transcript_25975/m.71272 type:complete len:410 (+) Transcript_25975:294-1523(+)
MSGEERGTGRTLRNCRRYGERSSDMLRSVLFFWATAAVLSVGTPLLGFGCYQPVAALTSSGSTSIPAVHRNAIRNSFQSEAANAVLFAAESRISGINSNDNDHDDNDVANKPQPIPSSPVSRTVAVAFTLYSSPILRVRSWKQQVLKGYSRRINADPSFVGKSITEVLVAAGTQLMAEWNRRGASRIMYELDFVVPAILTAISGKYYSMWRTAKTLDGDEVEETETSFYSRDPILFGRLPVPTNAFQARMADGVTLPTLKQRLGSFLVSIPPLFRAGIIASGLGYGFVSIVLAIRSNLMPSFQTETIPVNALHASIYTGCFMAVVSNIRYQILQGVIEPIVIDEWIFSGVGSSRDVEVNEIEPSNNQRDELLAVIRSFVIFAVRWMNGLLGSVLAISGMRFFGLQRMKI